MKQDRKNAPGYCVRCQQKLDPKKIVMLELDTRTDTYTDQDVPAEFSQGSFEFGNACAEIEKQLHREAMAEWMNINTITSNHVAFNDEWHIVWRRQDEVNDYFSRWHKTSPGQEVDYVQFPRSMGMTAADVLEDQKETPEPDQSMHYKCQGCGGDMTAAEGDDNGGYCNECAPIEQEPS